jgi:ribosome biogenesis GTPase
LIKGLVLKGIGGFYYVADETGNVFECKAAGRFRYEKMTPLPGDRVEFFTEKGDKTGFIENIMPRINEMKRPAVANITLLILTVSANKPSPDLLLIDRLLLESFLHNITPLILINKKDSADERALANILCQYDSVCETLPVSALTGEGIEQLRKKLEGHTACFAGQSAVGKTSVMNALMPMLHLKTGGLSKKTDRGKHTTRQTELVLLEGQPGAVLDTPGFSMMDTHEMDTHLLAGYYPDFQNYIDRCRFATCTHENEPDCAIKTAVEDGYIHAGRYERYIKILKELKEMRLKKYD